MKKIFTAFIVLLLFSLCLTSCGLTMPRPDVKEGKFDVSITYEVGGETKTLELIYLCEYNGVKMTLEGTRYRAWNGHFEGYEDGDVIEVSKTDDGSRIVLNFLIYAEYFMGEPDYVDFYPEAKTERIYFEDGIERKSNIKLMMDNVANIDPELLEFNIKTFRRIVERNCSGV